MSQKRIWALLDERQGNTSQTLGVAEALGLPFEVKKIAFNPFIRLPNPLINHSLLGVDKPARAQLQPPWPDIVIATARRLGIAASYIKSQHPQTFLAQIQWPGFPSRQFDLIAAPLHDRLAAAPNIIMTFGAPHRVTKAVLEREAQTWTPALSHLPSPRVTLLIGGSNRGWAFTEMHAAELGRWASNLANKLGGSLLITTSRRTDAHIPAILKQHLTVPHYLHFSTADDTAASNPYFGFLGLADVVIATGDSISLCSEACATGKPVYVYGAKSFVSPKHQMFLDALYARNLAKPLSDIIERLFTPAYRMNDADMIADEIKKRARFSTC